MRNKEKEEIDFLVSRDGKPWLPVEAKLSETDVVGHWSKFLGYLGCPVGLQIVATPGKWQLHQRSAGKVLVASAAEALLYFA